MATSSNSRIALITDGTKGLGLEIARQLANKGIEVLIGSRNEIHGEQIAEQLASENNLPVTYIQIDVAVTEYSLNEPRPSELTIDMLRQHFEVNFFGAYQVTKAFLPLLHQSSSGRIVNISNTLGSFYYYDTNKESYIHCAYSTSKCSLNMLTLLLAKDLKTTKIKVNACALNLSAIELTHYHNHRMNRAARSIFSLALLSDDGPSGKMFGLYGEEYKW